MTTIISLAARDFIAVGCDSLATWSQPLVNPVKMASTYFENGSLKLLPDGTPALKTPDQLFQLGEDYSVNQLPSVTKLHSLEPHRAALLFAGAGRIGDLSIKNLVGHLKTDPGFNAIATVDGIAQKVKSVWMDQYQKAFPNERDRPFMEVLLSGYSNGSFTPEVFRITFAFNWNTNGFECEIQPECSGGKYDLVLGGQYDVIQRIVMGVDISSWGSLKMRCWEILNNYKSEIQAGLAAAGLNYNPPDIVVSDPKFDLFSQNFGGVTRIFSDIGSLSEQAGISFVEFLIETMIKAQEFSSSIPTVGGDIHIGIIEPSDGFRWISREEYRLKDHRTPKKNA